MPTTRPFRGWDDLAAMQRVCSRTLLALPGRSAAHPGDIAWWVGFPNRSVDELGEQFLLWEDAGDVVGFASYFPDEGDLTILVSPTHAGTNDAVAFEDEAEAWATRRGVPPRWKEFEDEAEAIERWRSRGYAPIDGGNLNLVRSFDDLDPEAPPDARVQPVGDDDVEDRAAITHEAFADSMPFDRYAADYWGFRATPAYPDGWDLLLRDSDGAPAACCIAWPDPVSRAATFEPVATHPSKHRRGLGSALLREGFRRLASAGMTYAIVGVDLDNPAAEALYRSVGFEPDRMLRTYERR